MDMKSPHEALSQHSELTRRALLQMAIGAGVSFSLPAMAAVSARKRREERPKSLLVLWMAGGPSQLETWDPHPGTKTGGEVKDIATRNPELRISEMLPQMAEHMDSLSVVRSLTSKEGDHERGTYFMKTGYQIDQKLKHPAISAIAARELHDDRVEIPSHISLANSQWPAKGGYLGNDLDAFRIFDPEQGLSNLKSSVDEVRQAQRLRNLDLLSGTFRVGRSVALNNTLHQDTIDRALRMMSSKQLEAFHLDQESETVRNAYGRSRFGTGCLIARRLVEVGVRAIEVTLTGFDTHVNNHEGHRTQCELLDPAFASLMTDLKERDLLDSTLVLCIGEFGRTPIINATGGRDHWPNWFSCVVGGGGLRPGVVIGETPFDGDFRKESRATNPIEVPDLYATLLFAMGIEYDKEVITPIARPMKYTDGSPLEQLLGETLLARWKAQV